MRRRASSGVGVWIPARHYSKISVSACTAARLTHGVQREEIGSHRVARLIFWVALGDRGNQFGGESPAGKCPHQRTAARGTVLPP